MKLSRLGLGIAALVATVLTASAAGMFTNLPIVGGAAYCALFAGDGTTCVGSVPAGPTATTGNEKIPADTGLASGASPQTILIPSVTLGSGLTVLNSPLTGASITLTAQTTKLALTPAGTIAALTIVLPAATSLVNGQTLEVGSSQIVTALTTTAGSGTTVTGVPSGALGAIGGFKIVYVATSASAGTWYRIG